ncbi:diguanylate cyclase [Halopseudomonas sp.]|uniref:diguanylate cyclase n=1 Tax=Halopseudomonas sp. TaxID=2901191 RepID=UPI003001C84C
MSTNDQLLALRQQYKQTLPATLARIGTLAESLVEGVSPGDATQDRNTLSELLHKLAGSAGSFGLPALSAQASRLEKQLEQLEQLLAADPQDEKDGLLVGRLMADLRALGNFAKTDRPPDARYVSTAMNDGAQALEPEVWLLEDDELLGSSLVTHLEAFNFNARLFTTFASLAEAFTQEQPQVLVLDILLGTEGRSLDRLRETGLLKEARSRLIFISARDDFSARLQAAELGAEGFFIKPLDIPRLVTRVEQVLTRLHAPAERVLIVDDDELLAQYYQELLTRAGMQVEILHDPALTIETLERKLPDIVLMDLQMPEISGQNLAAVIRQYDQWMGLPIVYLSAEHDAAQQLRALNQGADDFLTKPVDDAHLITAVRSRVARSRQLLELMTKDSLTGLLKHATIKEALKREWAMARRKGETLCVAMLDIDHFKQVNDRFGHATGDEVIASVATLLRQRLRATDILGRYGGEEFAVVLANCDASAAAAVLDDFRMRFQELQFSYEGESFSVTISIGVAEYRPGMEIDADALLVHADKALYQAKTSGRNRLQVYGG